MFKKQSILCGGCLKWIVVVGGMFVATCCGVRADDFDDELFGDDGDIEFPSDFMNTLDTEVSEDFRVPSEEFTLWKKTGGSRSRDPLFLVPSRRAVWDKNFLSSTFFFNMSNRLSLCPHIVMGDSLISYVNKMLKDEDIAEQLAKEAGPLLKIFPYLLKMTVQERRIGTLLQAGITDGRWFLHIDLPVLLSERNFWIENKRERNDLKQIIKELDSLQGGSIKKIRYGLGDTKVKFGYDFIKKERVGLRGGVAAILPTSRIGHKRPRSFVKSKVGDDKTKLINDLLSLSNHIMIDPPLGVGHWGAGCFLDFRIEVIPRALTLWGHFSYDHYFEGSQYRLLPSNKKIPVGHFMELGKKENAAIPDDFPIADIFPHAEKVKMSPGDIFNATLGLDWKIKRWNILFGYDFYLQHAEKISKLCIPELRSSHLRVEDGLASKIMQHKVFGEVGYTLPCKGYDVQFGIGGDYTFASKGAAKDWTVHAKVGFRF